MQITSLDSGNVQRSKSRCIHQEGIFFQIEKLRMSCCMASPLDLLTDRAGLHGRLRLKVIHQGRLPHTGRSGQHRRPTAKQFTDRLHAFLLLYTCENNGIPAAAVALPALLLLCSAVQILLIEADHSRQILLFHRDQKPIQQIKIRLRRSQCKYNKRLIHI